jgi:WD40 repeat protein
VYDLAFSRDGRWLAGAGGPGRVLLWDLNETPPGQPALLPAHNSYAQSVAFLPDGRRLLSSGGDGRILLHDLARRELLHQWYLGGNSLKLALAPDGRHVAVGTAGGAVYLLRLKVAAD